MVFDCNVRSGSYSGVKTINYIDTHKESRDRCAEISAWNKDINEFRRIINIKGSNGQAMSMEEMNIAALDIMAHFTDGRLVLEDTNKYLFGAGQKKFVSEFVTTRHKNVDLVLLLQSWSKVNPVFAGNASLIRLHCTGDSCDKAKENLCDSYEVVKLAELIVKRQYNLNNIRFFLYIDLRKYKIIGTNEISFRFACRQFLLINPSELKMHMQMNEISDRDKAIEDWTSEKVRLYLPAVSLK